jgi:addiction module HigA family antidote
MKLHNPAHPGMLIADILENGNLSVGTSVTALAKHLGVTGAALLRVINGKAAVSAEMALNRVVTARFRGVGWHTRILEREQRSSPGKHRLTWPLINPY